MINVSSNIGEVQIDIEATIEELPNTLEDFAHDAINVMTEIPRKYIPARHRRQRLQRTTDTATGRLWSGWGRRTNVYTDNPLSNELDNVARVEKTSTGSNIFVGTNIRYSSYVNEGVNTPEYLFSERGNEEIQTELDKLMNYHSDRLIGKERISAMRSRLARTQGRTTLGRFTEKLFR